MSDLRRTKVGPFMLADAIPMKDITVEKIAQNLRYISGAYQRNSNGSILPMA
jgi:tRNA U55 pseudouridine synthase TruB